MSEIRVAQADAASFWHITPCQGEVRFEMRPTLYYTQDGGGGAAAESGWDNFLARAGQNLRGREGPEPINYQQFTNCVVFLNIGYFTRQGGILQDWPEFCEVMGHEYEHLTNQWRIETSVDNGHAKMPSRRSIAYPEYTHKNTPPQCAHRPQGAYWP